MATAKKQAAGKKPGTSIVKWDEALAARAKIAQKAEASVMTGSFISLKAGQMSFNGNIVPGNKMEVIVVDGILENVHYDSDYDANNPRAPSCYAFGRSDEEMAPYEKAEEPQSDRCKGCPHNEWGSAGRGKACRNVRRLALIPASVLDEGADAIRDAAFAFLRVPVTSVKAYAGYVNQLAAQNRPPLAYVTEISVTPDPTSQFKVSFNAVEAIEDGALIQALLDKADAAEDQIAFPYAENSAEPAQKGRRAPAKQAPPARAAAARAPAKQAPAAAKPARRKF